MYTVPFAKFLGASRGLDRAAFVEAVRVSKPPFVSRSTCPVEPHVAVKFLPVAFGPTVTEIDAGENVQPDFEAVTV